MRNIKNLSITLFISLIFSVTINFTYLNLFQKNFEKNQYLYPSETSEYIYQHHDLDDNFQWLRRSHENNSIFKLSANIHETELENRHHFQSSRGLSYYIAGLFLNFSNESLNVAVYLKVIFITISIFLFFVVLKNYHRDKFLQITIISLTIIFANKLFGGVLNPFHYIEYFFDIKNFYISRSIDRIPNILIQNVFVVLNFLLIKKYFRIPNKKNLIYLVFNLILTGFITPIIFIVYSICIGIFYLYKFILNKIFFLRLFLFSLLFFPFLIFHYFNLNLINDGSLESPQWTGNYLYDLEIFIGPIAILLVFFGKRIKIYKTEIIFFISQLIFYSFAFFYDIYLASKINENFIYINSLISFSILFRSIYLKNHYLNLKLTFLFSLLFCFYIFLQHQVKYQYLYLIVIFLVYLISRSLIKKIIFKIFLSFSTFLILFIFSYNHYLVDDSKYEIKTDYEYTQKKLINYLNKHSELKKTFISLDFGLLKNLSIHTNHNIYFINITNTNFNENNIIKRLFDAIYLHGFTKLDFENFLDQIELQNSTSHDDFNQKNIKILFSNIYHHQTISQKQKILELVDRYELYLRGKEYNNINFFDQCIINPMTKKFIKENSFFDSLQEKKLIYKDYLEVYSCSID